jgi:hypothetical protein
VESFSHKVHAESKQGASFSARQGALMLDPLVSDAAAAAAAACIIYRENPLVTKESKIVRGWGVMRQSVLGARNIIAKSDIQCRGRVRPK